MDSSIRVHAALITYYSTELSGVIGLRNAKGMYRKGDPHQGYGFYLKGQWMQMGIRCLHLVSPLGLKTIIPVIIQYMDGTNILIPTVDGWWSMHGRNI